MESNSKLILVYSLEMNANNESLLFRCDKYNTIEFILGSTLFGRQIILYTNYSNDLNKFSYYRYHDLKFDSERASIRFENSGSFHFYYTERKNDSVCGNLYIVVNPKLTVGINSNLKQLDLNAIQCQTVLSKCLGKFETWKSKLEVFFIII
jgi:glycogen debranching enzyme